MTKRFCFFVKMELSGLFSFKRMLKEREHLDEI